MADGLPSLDGQEDMVGSRPSSPSKPIVEDCQKMDSHKADKPDNDRRTLRRSPRLNKEAGNESLNKDVDNEGLNKDAGNEKADAFEKRKAEVMKELELFWETTWGGRPENFPMVPLREEDLKPPHPVMDLEKCNLGLASMSPHDRAIFLGHKPGSKVYRQMVNPTMEDREEMYEKFRAGSLCGNGEFFNPLTAEEIDQYLGRIYIFIDQFVDRYLMKDNKIIERLTGEQKDQIIRSLRGWAQPRTWEDAVKLLHPTTAELLPEIVVRTMIAKRIYGDILMDPFFWLDDEGGQVATQRPCDKLFYPSYTEMTNLYHWFKRVTPDDEDWVHRWTTAAVRCLVGASSFTSAYPPLGKQMRERRSAKLEELKADLMRQLQPFLIDYEEGSEEMGLQKFWLRQVFDTIHDLHVGIWVSESWLEYSQFSLLGPCCEDHPDMELATVQRPECYVRREMNDPLPENRAVLFMLLPSVTRQTHIKFEDRITEKIQKASVVVTRDTYWMEL
ncbi:hypothetical protein ATEIFO6365_0005025600 [Aspergillus terreus]|uniref:Uncharacterized protein n=1 Tax=Aspergillus terreus TaxID=33178 RepID=A0A5M3Z0N6_ASPTE|nr:hypothetical protein ATETN484_0007026100 [Aspergillus terreus]GFF16066.1 hypothetical protein ATEIFO6365_0005025600 [Aspergillus terreus]